MSFTLAIWRCRLRSGVSSCRTRELMSSSRTPHSARFAARLRLGGYQDSRRCPERVVVRASLRSLITSAGRPPGLRLPPTHTNAPEFGTMLALPVAAVSVAQSLAKTVTLRCDLELEVPVYPRRSSQRHEHYTKELRCSAQGGGWEVVPAT